jgi:cytochrome c553
MRTALRSGLAAGLFVLPFAMTVGPTRADEPDPDRRVSVAQARERAKLMHEVYAATLDSMHHHFFRRDRAVLPARAMDDVFAQVGRRTGVEAKWIAVNTPAMTVDHEPKSAFEKEAAAAIAGGKASFEKVEGGSYQRAGVIPLGTGCVSCHTRSLTPDKTPRFAGLVVRVPVKGE